MRILFICGCFEPGRDGVGDYTRMLARACLQLGHECAIVALNDPYVDQATESDDDGQGGWIRSLRLPRTLAWDERVRRTTAFRDQFRPDWQSLQLVSYGMQRKGILWPVNRYLQALLAGWPLHIMYHEVWLGLFPGTSLKYRLVGSIQRVSLKRLGQMLQADVATTSNALYRAFYSRIGITTAVAPLLSNIPIAPAGGTFPEAFTAAGITPANRDQWWIGVFFGELYPEWKPEPFFSIVRRAAQKNGRKLAFVSLGRAGAYGPGMWQQYQKDYPDFTFVTMGEQSFETVSAVMQVCDFGVPTTALQLIGKSGSATAMLEHGLPIVVTRLEPQSRFPFRDPPNDDPLIFPCDDTFEAKMTAGLPRHAPHARAPQIAASFCDILTKTASVRATRKALSQKDPSS